MGTNTMRKQQGFTLIEIAIVLVIIGLLLGGVLKGQELINAARVRNIASQLDGVKIAYLGFQDRFRALPGDYPTLLANANIPGTPNGCGVAGATCGNGIIDLNENLVVWNQLSKANFITGSYSGAVGAGAAFVPPTAATNPTNPFSGYLMLANDTDYADGALAAAPNPATNIKTGGNVPAATVAELDRKVDDGVAGTGSFRVAPAWDASTITCYTAGAPITYAAATEVKSCGGTALQ
jgi:prepilin-type N-terminal cleavage/methylation domain-containing protein